MDHHDQAIEKQPENVFHNDQSKNVEINVRNLRDTQEDALVAGRLFVDAFRSKFVHATSAGSIPDCERITIEAHRGQEPIFYERRFVAECEGTVAGVLVLKFNGDPEPKDEVDVSTIGCCDVCGLWCLLKCEEEKVKPGQCLLDLVGVDNQFRGRGIGTVLMQKAEQEALQQNCHTIYLLVSSDNRAVSLYTRQGYVQKSRVCGYLWCRTGKCAMIKMEKNL